MSLERLMGALVVGAFVAFAPAASAQVESSPMTEESRPAPPQGVPAPPPPPVAPRKDPALFGVGVTATAVGGLALPIGGMLLIADVGSSVGSGLECAGQVGQPCRSSSDALGTVGAVLLVSGVILLVAGIPMIIVGGKRVARDAALEPFIVRF
jgi:hypothetical protein